VSKTTKERVKETMLSSFKKSDIPIFKSFEASSPRNPIDFFIIQILGVVRSHPRMAEYVDRAVYLRNGQELPGAVIITKILSYTELY
jgi:hypothetical protein